jgi:hypothetical protein
MAHGPLHLRSEGAAIIPKMRARRWNMAAGAADFAAVAPKTKATIKMGAG